MNGLKVFVSVAPDYHGLPKVLADLRSLDYDAFTRVDGVRPEDCDVFFGIITPGVGLDDDVDGSGESLTCREIGLAYACGMPRFMMANYRVAFAHSYCRAIEKESGTKKKKLAECCANCDCKPDSCMEKRSNMLNKRLLDVEPKILDADTASCKSVEAYRLATLDSVRDITARIGNWVQEFFDEEDVTSFIAYQFASEDRIREIVESWRVR